MPKSEDLLECSKSDQNTVTWRPCRRATAHVTPIIICNSCDMRDGNITRVKVKYSKAIPVTGRGGLKGCEMFRIPHCPEIRLAVGGKVVSPTHRPRSTPKRACSGYSISFFIVPLGYFLDNFSKSLPVVDTNLIGTKYSGIFGSLSRFGNVKISLPGKFLLVLAGIVIFFRVLLGSRPYFTVKVTLRPTVNRPVGLGVKPNLGPMTKLILLSDSCGILIEEFWTWQSFCI
jgi:hypothetical protein